MFRYLISFSSLPSLLVVELPLTTGCSGAVNRALSKLSGIFTLIRRLIQGVSNVDISLKDQLVKVDATTASYEDVENAIKKTGKVIKSGKKVENIETPTTAAAGTPSTVVEKKPIDQATKITTA
jgi:copper chaperone CopZ